MCSLLFAAGYFEMAGHVPGGAWITVIIVITYIVLNNRKKPKKMKRITDLAEVEIILQKDIMENEEMMLEDFEDHEWLVVGNIQKTQGEYEYGFRNKSGWTMWCDSLGIRRWPTGPERDQIIEQEWK